jgi:peroxiredoxin
MTNIFKALCAVLFLLTIAASPSDGTEVGDFWPEFVIQTFDGSSLSRAALDGKPVLLVFWNTWCPSCLRELPEVSRVAETFGPRGLVVLAINTGINDSESKARAYWKKHGYGFPVGFDHEFAMGQAFGVLGVPTIFLIDAKGIVRYKQALLPEDMEKHFEQLAGT